MPRSQGFSRGDIDTAFPLDDKFLSLRGRLSSEQYYATVGVYFTIVAATWREADRKPGLRVAPDAGPIVDELKAAGLLDSEGRVTTRAFTSWIGRAKRQRKSSAERQAKNRAGKSRVTNGDTTVTNGESPPARVSAPLRSEGTVDDVTLEGGPGGDFDALDKYHALTLYRPWGQWSGDKLRVAMADYGNATVEAALDEAHGQDADRKSLLDRALAILARNAEHAKLEAKPKSKTKRETPEEKADREARYNALRAELSVVKGMPA